MVMYEVHVGTFTPERTFEAIIPRLDELKKLGINAVELMPVAQFPRDRNWGYDGVYIFAPQYSYGGPTGLKRLVNECHGRGIAVILDVVYNHLGPEGNYLADFGPYFTSRYKTEWGQAMNFDGPHSDEVRNFFIENALHWLNNYHIDALRLDAVHAIVDLSATHFLAELADRVRELGKDTGRKQYLIAESNLNDSRLITPRQEGGFGLDAQWLDDFHHCIHTLLTGESGGYYADFGSIDLLVKSLREGFAYSGQRSEYRMRRHGAPARHQPAERFVVFTQNHDQIGNRMLGDRLTTHLSFEMLKLDAAITLLSPYVPLFFMGEEYAEDAPFKYFVSHGDPDLIEAVRRGRRQEFASFLWEGEVSDPQDPETFLQSTLSWEKRKGGRHRTMLKFFTRLLALRRRTPALALPDNNNLEVFGCEEQNIIAVKRRRRTSRAGLLFNFGAADSSIAVPWSDGEWKLLLDSSGQEWEGPGSLLPARIHAGDELVLRAHSAALFR
jgi:maltooligosyltrehalose trehalohydrolase